MTSSWIDKLLVKAEWEDFFLYLIQEVSSCPVLDHFPIVLESSRVKWGLTPCRFENMWLQHHSLLDTVKYWWGKCSVSRWEGYKFIRS